MNKTAKKIIVRVCILAAAAGLAFLGSWLARGWLIFNGPSPYVCRQYIAENGESGLYYKLFAKNSPNTAPESVPAAAPEQSLADAFPKAEKERLPGSVQLLESQPGGSIRDQYGLVDEDGDGVVVMDVGAEGYRGILIVCWDPSRVILGMQDNFNTGLTVKQICAKYGALGGINAGGFEDPGGNTNGGKPSSIVISEGEYYNYKEDKKYQICGLDEEGKLVIGTYTPAEMRDMRVRDACAFGPILMVDGYELGETTIAGGLYPRSAIAQRDDGAIMLLAIDGYQAHSAGCTGVDLVALLKEYHAVTAYNLDGGASTCMVWDGETINTPASMYTDRTIPNAWIILPEGGAGNGNS